MRHRHDAVRRLQACLHDVHVLAPDGVVQHEHVPVVLVQLQQACVREGRAALVGHVVDHKHAAGKGQLVVVAVVGLEGRGGGRGSEGRLVVGGGGRTTGCSIPAGGSGQCSSAAP